MGQKARKGLKALLALGVAVGLAGGIWTAVDHWRGSASYSEAEELAGINRPREEPEPTEPTNPEPTEPAYMELTGSVYVEMTEQTYVDSHAAELAGTDLAALREVNSQVVGWIAIPETELSYPMVQAEDNDYYLNRTWKMERSSLGAIFLECQVRPDFSDFNTIIYGHRMRNGSMFGSLKHYDDISYWEEHPSIYIVDDSGVHRYDIFAAYEPDVTALTFGLGISRADTKQRFIQLALEASVIDTGVTPTTQDQILTLSTCTGRGYSTRWVVQAVLRDGQLPPGAVQE